MGNILSDYFSLYRDLRRPKIIASIMGQEIIDISGLRNNWSQKSADPDISEPRNNDSSTLSELGLLDSWILPGIKYHMSLLPTLYLVWYLPAVHVIHHPHQIIITHTPTACRACCVWWERELFPHTKATASVHHHHHSSSTAAAAAQQQQQQQQRRWRFNVAGDSSPSVYHTCC